jgi:hypothetical protein
VSNHQGHQGGTSAGSGTVQPSQLQAGGELWGMKAGKQREQVIPKLLLQTSCRVIITGHMLGAHVLCVAQR